GRALALQLIGVALARGDGLPVEQIVIDPIPPWLTDEPEPAARAIAEVAIRRALFPGHPFAFVQPASEGVGELWGYLRASAAVHAGDLALVLARLDPGGQDGSPSTSALRAATLVGREVAAGTTPGALTGVALDHARAVVSAAAATLDALRDQGWRTVAGDPLGASRGLSRGLETIAERSEAFDPFEGALGKAR
ncbi:MAG TPA: hypothetical protein VF494_12720, partial [Candidatus Limnocylindrales bacterium]